MASVISSDSVATILKIGRLKRQQAELNQRLAQEQQAQFKAEELAMKREDRAIEHEYDKEIERLKGQISMNEKALVALGFADEKDANANGVPDIVEQLKFTTEQIDRKFKQAQIKQDQRREEIKDQTEARLKEKELNLKEREINNKLRIAETNKNRWDFKT